jgi:hypothetical protein
LEEISKPVEVERRKVSRVPQSLILCIQPLDSSMQPVGSSFQAITRDISAKGLGFLYGAPFPTNFVRIGATKHSRSQAIGRVCYNKAYYGEKVVFLVGVEFLDQDSEKAG